MTVNANESQDITEVSLRLSRGLNSNLWSLQIEDDRCNRLILEVELDNEAIANLLSTARAPGTAQLFFKHGPADYGRYAHRGTVTIAAPLDEPRGLARTVRAKWEETLCALAYAMERNSIPADATLYAPHPTNQAIRKGDPASLHWVAYRDEPSKEGAP